VSAADQREWWERSPSALVHRAMGSDPFAVDHAAVERQLEETRAVYRERFGRELREDEVAHVRKGAELRSAPPAPGRVIRSTAELVEAVNSANVSAGWSYTPLFRRGEGMAIRQPDGTWTGDPAIAAATQAAEEDKLRLNEEKYQAWRNGPLVLRTIAAPS
jgi:hypothetical protein